MADTPTKRTLNWCRDMGWMAEVTEHWVNSATANSVLGAFRMGMPIPKWTHKSRGNLGTRRDLFGFIDVICIRPDSIVAIQATTLSNASARVHKIQGECCDSAEAWLAAGGLIEVWGWNQYETKQKVQFADKETYRRWRPKITDFVLDDSPMPF